MNLRIALSGLVALACVSVLATDDLYSMTYQPTAESRVASTKLVSFAIARQVVSQPSGDHSTPRHAESTSAPTSGQIMMSVGKNPAAQADTFKKGAQFAKMTITLSGRTPAGAIVASHRWTLTQAVIDSYSVASAGTQATINLHWKSITVSTP